MDDSNFSSIFRKVMRLHFSLIHAELDKLGLYPGQPHLLTSLMKNDGQSQKEISTCLLIKPATMTVMIKRLEKNGFIYKKPDKIDGRISRIFLTDKGRDACTRLKEVSDNIDEICLKDFSKKDSEELNILLNKMKTNLETHKKL